MDAVTVDLNRYLKTLDDQDDYDTGLSCHSASIMKMSVEDFLKSLDVGLYGRLNALIDEAADKAFRDTWDD